MHVIFIMAGSIGLMFGSMVAGVLACWLLWFAFKVARHPEWGPPFVLVPAALAVTGYLPTNEFLVLALIFAGLAIIPFCAEGIAWRARKIERRRADPIDQTIPMGIKRGSSAATMLYRRYPAVIGCISEGRRANPDELKKVASRILGEAFGEQYPTRGFAARRAALRAAKAALDGN